MFSDIGGSLKNSDPVIMPKTLQGVYGQKVPPAALNKPAHTSIVSPAKSTTPTKTVPKRQVAVSRQKIGDGLYALHFSIFYKTIVGESIAVVGNLEELGAWVEYKCHLEWTEGHVWRSVEPILVRETYFEYKYVLLQDK